MKRLRPHAFLILLMVGAEGSGPVLAAPDPAPVPPITVPDRLDLKMAIGFALANNFAIREARERIKQQEGVVLEVRGKSIPNVVAQGLYQENSTSISPTFPASTTFWQGSVIATQTLYAGGGVRSSIRNANLTREAAALDLQATINQALLDVRTRFYNVLLAREKIRVQEENIGLLKSQLKDASDRFETGTTSSFDKLRADVALANGQVPLITARNDFRIAVEQLRQSLGFASQRSGDLQKVPEFDGVLTYTSASFDLAACLEAAHANRPELQRLAKEREAGEQSVVTARSNYYPNLALAGGWEAEKAPFALSGSSSSSVNGWRIGLQSQWNIFDGASTSGRVAQARSLLQQAKLTLDEQTLAIDVEVRQAYSAWQEADELAAATQKTVGQAEESLRLATARYEAGAATHLDVLQAQVDLTQARVNQVQADYTDTVALAQLREAMGMADDYSVN